MADPVYTRLVQTATRLIQQYGSDAQLVRTTSTGPSYDPAVTTEEYNLKAVETGYSITNRSDSLIKTGDVVGILEVGGEAIPQPSDQLRIGGSLYSFHDFLPLNPGGVTIFYEFIARK